MKVSFKKYQGTGNDFVIIDNRSNVIDKSNLELIKQLCNRKFGIGSDGLILIENHAEYDFNMVFFNPDGSQSFCGNGSRCAVQFAYDLGIIKEHTTFISTDGWHEAFVLENKQIKLKMNDVLSVENNLDYYFLNTGSPHYVAFKKELSNLDILTEGRAIRYLDKYKNSGGTNVNFIEKVNNIYKVRTYERGVENETLSCGTGVTACALSIAIQENLNEGNLQLTTEGGMLNVSFKRTNVDGFEQIWLTGPATFVFDGVITV